MRPTVDCPSCLLGKSFSSFETAQEWHDNIDAMRIHKEVKVPKVRMPKVKVFHKLTDLGICLLCSTKPRKPDGVCKGIKKPKKNLTNDQVTP